MEAVRNGSQPTSLMLRCRPTACLEARTAAARAPFGPSFEAARTLSVPHLRMRALGFQGLP
jgi:hypothetical protein